MGTPSGHDILGGNEFRLRQGFALQNACDAAPAAVRARRSIAVQLEDGHEGFSRHLDGAEVPHLLLARPMKCGYISWGPLQDMTSSAEMNSACGKVLLRKTLVTPHRRR